MNTETLFPVTGSAVRDHSYAKLTDDKRNEMIVGTTNELLLAKALHSAVKMLEQQAPYCPNCHGKLHKLQHTDCTEFPQAIVLAASILREGNTKPPQ